VRALIVPLMRIMLISTVIFSVSGLLMGVLQSNGIFLAPALAAVLYNVGMALGALVLGPGLGIYGAAIGVVIGALLHLGVQLPSLRRAYLASRPSTDMDTPELKSDVRGVLHAMPWRMIGSGAVYFNNLVRDGIAVGFPAGVSSLNNAFATMILPQAAIAQAIGTALFPTISAHAARGDRAEFGRALAQATGAVLALSTPAAAGLIVLGQPLIALLFERGAFTALNTRQVGLSLAMYALGLVAHCVLELITRAFYALKDNKPPVLLAVGSMIVNVALSYALLPVFEPLTDFPFVALALANTIATALETVVLYAMLLRRAPELGDAGLPREFCKALLGAAAMAAVVWLWLRVMGDGALATLSAVVIGAAVYVGCSVLTRSALTTLVARLRR
jgi:putative peptidoglycan lipid II flippase